jgi:hypothetical protein
MYQKRIQERVEELKRTGEWEQDLQTFGKDPLSKISLLDSMIYSIVCLTEPFPRSVVVLFLCCPAFLRALLPWVALVPYMAQGAMMAMGRVLCLHHVEQSHAHRDGPIQCLRILPVNHWLVRYV